MRHVNKLVRDGIPAIIAASGHQPDVVVLDPAAFRANLEDKLEEELAEYRETRAHTELMDIVEVIQAILEAEGVDWAAFERDRAARRAERGAFHDRIWLRAIR